MEWVEKVVDPLESFIFVDDILLNIEKMSFLCIVELLLTCTCVKFYKEQC